MRFGMLQDNNNGGGVKDRNSTELRSEESEINLNFANDFANGLTLEGIRRSFNSCFTCGVSWYDKHVSLDCRECGGYAMVRPCPACDGQCESTWRRDTKASHLQSKAQWHGTCSLNQWESQSFLDDANANYNSGCRSIATQTQCSQHACNLHA